MCELKKKLPLVSILIAAYNEEKYIQRCVESVLNQTYTNLEIIIVNDGSEDSTYEICNRLSQKDSRIKLINQENRGISMARKCGLENSTGDYIQFVDSDDWCEPGRTQLMLNALEQDDTDIVFSSAYRHRDDGIAIISNLPIKEGVYTVDEIKKIYVEPLFGDFKADSLITTGYVWCCMYRRNVLSGLQFYPALTLHEDEIINLQALSNAKNISVIKDVIYNYNRRLNTLSKRDSYWCNYWENMAEMYYAKKDIGTKMFSDDKNYLHRLCTAILNKFLRTIRNETHYANPAHFWGGLKNLYGLHAENLLDEAFYYVQPEEFTFTERFLIQFIKKRLYFVPYFYYAIKTNRMRNFYEKTKN